MARKKNVMNPFVREKFAQMHRKLAKTRAARSMTEASMLKMDQQWVFLVERLRDADLSAYVPKHAKLNTPQGIYETVLDVIRELLDDIRVRSKVGSDTTIVLPCVLASVYKDDFALINSSIKTIFPRVRYKMLPDSVTGPFKDYPRAVFYTGKTPNALNIRILMQQKGVKML